MRFGPVTQQPDERQSYTINFARALTEGDNLESAVATATPNSLTVNNVGVHDARVRLWVSGGISGTTYTVEVTTTTADGRIFQDELIVKVKER